jgi:hypothetical protein
MLLQFNRALFPFPRHPTAALRSPSLVDTPGRDPSRSIYAEGDTFALGINRQNHGIDLHSSLGRQ